ncbi:acyl-CoA thioesterase [Oceanobacillus halophilus]|uniref:Acyl-CoA thioesterase n=1 Tax=Oceanobacillus halophilus TaxID=930130 RepID=A0A495ADC7_9BACI|nr:thioesterase family protein [Oceanobacillus halophilus]RKQ37938.1 acyl-CoA thioesterase [Oceanobacillus halophilus]
MADYIENMEKWKSEFEFWIPIKIRFSETDMYGHVNNVSAFIYFEEARIDFLYAKGLHHLMEEDGGAVMVADQQCDYRRQIFFNETIRLYVKIAHVGRTSFDLHYMAVNAKGEVALTGRGRVVYIDLSSSKPKALNDKIREKLFNKKAKTDSLQ